MSGFDFIELLEYMAGFWLFLFSPSFRAITLADWRERPWLFKAFIPFEIALATAFGLGPFVGAGLWLIDR